MGFGLLFIGYLITFFLSFVLYGFIIRLAGYLLMTLALVKLYEYERRYIYPFIGSLILFIIGALVFVREGAGILGLTTPAWMSAEAGIIPFTERFAVSLFNIALLYVTAVFAARLELFKQRNMALRNMVIVGVYLIIHLLEAFVFAGSEVFATYFSLPVLIIQFVWIVLNMILIFSCYMYICPEGDEDMPRRKTNIRFLDKVLEESDRRFDKAAKETTDYFTEKIKKKQNKTKGKNKK